ncbi:acyloxyacyl hydrolase [Flavobacterium sangjuense]|uniref:Outer membrane protein beta-barrel domain-containing protein n=1 Tax=Flavobacterium sangjuense TaxID=2518177 RepID=A0A4V1CC72_9FLAO|nr:acyloxyacyl hydrolase [Flavobacterium sangjuense]QBZ98474.1 hypothetical protein GS03_01982 [Flavobacterium sangjuense]
MKKKLISVLVILISYAALAQSTPEKKESKFELTVNTKLGFAKLKQTGNVALNGNINGGDILFSLPLGKTWKIASGIGYFEYNANPTIAGNTASLKNTYLHIPLQFNSDLAIFNNENTQNQKIFFNLGLGLYTNTLLKQELETITDNTSTKNMGWNFGFSSQIGLKFLLTDALNLGMGLESQSDFTKMKKDGAEQRIEQINALYFKMGFTF